MLVFACSDKGGTGRTVTTCNLAFQLSMLGASVAYLDFDFGSPTAGAVFDVAGLERGAEYNGLHGHIQDNTPLTVVDVRQTTNRRALKTQPGRLGKLVLVPGDRGGGEFGVSPETIKQTVRLLVRMESQYKVTVVDLSAGRSTALQMALRALAHPDLARKQVRWLLFHRWTRQHLLAAGGLLFGDNGIRSEAKEAGLDPDDFLLKVRTVRTAVPDLRAATSAASGPQAAWLQRCDRQLDDLARDQRLGSGILLGSTPMEPMLQWREQLIMPEDVAKQYANAATQDAFEKLARDLVDDEHWQGLTS